ncbi:MAG TPA: zinc ribbon domain-containing protein [Verrucomicrobiae bacterium]|nr:zinc ribbon domain-containing protein [Verrucomicrobiae bacterium]
MLTCSKCGYDNELGRIFCHSCGAKLDLSEIKAPSQGGAKLKRKGGTGSKLVGRTIGILILAILIVGVFLLAQVPAVPPISTTNQELRSAEQKRFDLDQLGTRKVPQQIAFTGNEINALIGTLGFKTGDGNGLWVKPTDLRVELGNGVITAVFLGKMSIGNALSKAVYLSLTGTPTIEDGKFVFKPVNGAIGALPLSPWVIEHTGLVKNYFATILAGQGKEEQILDSLKSITVTPQEVVLNYDPTAAGQ